MEKKKYEKLINKQETNKKVETNSLENKRLKSTKKYVDSLQSKYSKINVIRFDASYKKPHSSNVTLNEANKDFNKMLNNRRNNTIFDGNIGYICKKEYTKDKGVHFHTVFFFDGQKVKNDVKKAIDIGKYWNEKITNNKGTIHNCNLNSKKDYGIKDATGMLDYRDAEKRKKLDYALGYLCKDDEKQDIKDIKDNEKDRAFVRGTVPKSKSNAGRPRKQNTISKKLDK